MIGVVIPTLERPEFLIRQLRYYREFGTDLAVYVGDSSSGPNAEKIRRALEACDGLGGSYLPCQGMNDREAMRAAVAAVREPYCVYAGDDDLLVPESLRRCSAFLAHNASYRTAQGRAALFSVRGDGAYGALGALGDYWGEPAREEEAPSRRLGRFAEQYWVCLFAVHRTHEFLADLQPFAALADRSFGGEVAPNFLTVARGKSKFIDGLHLFRQVHHRRYALPGPLDWIMSPHWYAGCEALMEELARVLAEYENLSMQDAHAVAKDIVTTHLQRGLVRKLSTSATTRLRRVVQRHAPALASMLRRAGGLGGGRRAITLAALARKSSPYFAAFSSVQHILSAPAADA